MSQFISVEELIGTLRACLLWHVFVNFTQVSSYLR